MKTFNCVHPMCNKKAVSYCGHVIRLNDGKKEKITAGLCEDHSKRMLKRVDTEDNVEWVEPWKNGKKWVKKNGLVYYNTRLNPQTMVPYSLRAK